MLLRATALLMRVSALFEDDESFDAEWMDAKKYKMSRSAMNFSRRKADG